MKIWPPLGLCCAIPGKEDEMVAMTRCESIADIADSDAAVTLIQHFENPSFGTKKEDQEAVYKFPLVGDVAVYHFKSSYLSEQGDVLKTMIGKAKEKQQAREEYEQAKANGKAAQLLEVDYENSPDLFVMSVGNIPSNCKTVVVEIAYYCPLQTEERGVVKRFTLPSILTGRYGKYNARAFKGNNVSKTAALFNFEANVCLGDYIASLESPTHTVTSKLMVDGSPCKANISFSKDTEPLNKDLVLKISSGAEPKSSILVQNPETVASEGFLADFPDTTLAKLTFNCNVETDEDAEVKKNFIFVVDRSGSMSGASMKNCIKALELCVASLPAECCFDICSFGSRFDFLFGGQSRDYSEETLKLAREHIQSMRANYGGTEILKPMQKIVETKGELPTVVFLLTDGQVYNTAAIVQLIKKAHQESGTTVFTCGIGSGVDRHLVDGLAKAGGGTATYIAYGEKMNAKMAAQMEQAVEPPCTNLKVELGSLALSSSKLGWNPNALLPPFVYSGQRIDCYLAVDSNSVFGLQKQLEGGDVPVNISLRGKMMVDDKETTLSVAEIDLKSSFLLTNSNLVVPAFRQQISLIEEAIKAKKSEKKKAVKYAVAANIVTKYTSLVAVEEGNDGQEREARMEKPKVKVVETRLLMSRGGLTNSGGGSMRKKKAKMMRKPAMMSRPPPSSPPMMSMEAAPQLPMMSRPPPSLPPMMSMEAAPQLPRMSRPPPSPELFKMSKRALPMRKRSASFSSDMSSLALAEDEKKEVQATFSAPPVMKAVEQKQLVLVPLLSEDDKLRAIIGLQSTNGSFVMSPTLKGIIGKDDFNGDEKLDGFATALVIKFFEMKLMNLKAEWKLLHKKAIKWMKKNVTGYEAVLEASSKHI